MADKPGRTSSIRIRESDLRGDCARLNRRLDLMEQAVGVTGEGGAAPPVTSSVRGGTGGGGGVIVPTPSPNPIFVYDQDVTLTPVSQTALIDASAGDRIITLPDMKDWIGRDITIVKNDNSSHTVTWATFNGDQTVNGNTSGVMTEPGQSITFRAIDATHAIIVAESVVSVTAPLVPTAPNVLNTSTATPYYVPDGGNGQLFGFSGKAFLPTTHPEYSHFKQLDVMAVDPKKGGHLIQIFKAPFTGTFIDYKGPVANQPLADETPWSVMFVPRNEVGTPNPTPFSTPGVTIYAAKPSAAAGADASTLAHDDPNYHPRWQDSAPTVRTVLNITISMARGQYPQVATIWTDSQDGKPLLWHGWFAVQEDNQVISLGLPDTDTDVYPPGAQDGSWIATVAAGPIPKEADIPANALATAPFTVPAILVPQPDWIKNCYVDKVLYGNNGSTATFGWENMYARLPYDEIPEFWFARWTVRHGSMQGGVFVPGTPAQGAQSDGKQTTFTDDDGGGSVTPVLRNPGTNQVSVTNPKCMWTLPPPLLDDGSPNPNDTFEFKVYAGSRHPSDGTEGTLVQQLAWSSGVGVSTPGTAAALYMTLDLSRAYTDGRRLDPEHKIPPSVIPVSQGVIVDEDGIKLGLGAGLTFDDIGQAQVNAGAGVGFDISGEKIVLNAGSGIGIDGANKAYVLVSNQGPIWDDGHGLAIRMAGGLTVTGSPGSYILTQGVADLATSVGFDATNFTTLGGAFVINKIAVNTLIAGNAFFTGQAVFAYAAPANPTVGLSCVIIDGTGITLADKVVSPTSVVAVTSTSVQLAKAGHSLTISANGISIFRAKAGPPIATNDLSMNLDATGFSVVDGSNNVTVTASLVSITGGTNVSGAVGQLLADSTGLKISTGSNSVLASANGVTITGPLGSVNLNSTGVSVSSGTNSVAVSSSAITLTRGSHTLTMDVVGIGMSTGGSLPVTSVLSASGITFTMPINTTRSHIFTADATSIRLLVNDTTLTPTVRSSVTVTASQIQFVSAGGAAPAVGAILTMSATNIVMTGPGATGPTTSLTLDSSKVELIGNNAKLVLTGSTFAISATGSATVNAISMNSAGLVTITGATSGVSTTIDGNKVSAGIVSATQHVGTGGILVDPFYLSCQIYSNAGEGINGIPAHCGGYIRITLNNAFFGGSGDQQVKIPYFPI